MVHLKLTDEEANLLALYINITTDHRQRQEEACRELAKEKKPDGSPKFPKMASNAEWWARTNSTIEGIKERLDATPREEETT